MKNYQIKKAYVFVLALIASVALHAQEPQKVALVQTPGAFIQQELKLEAGKSYVFEVENSGVDKAIGFVIAPKGMTEQKNHIPNAYLSKTIEDGETASSKEVVLEKGEYVYFCPLNPTPLYSIVVE